MRQLIHSTLPKQVRPTIESWQGHERGWQTSVHHRRERVNKPWNIWERVLWQSIRLYDRWTIWIQWSTDEGSIQRDTRHAYLAMVESHITKKTWNLTCADRGRLRARWPYRSYPRIAARPGKPQWRWRDLRNSLLSLFSYWPDLHRQPWGSHGFDLGALRAHPPSGPLLYLGQKSHQAHPVSLVASLRLGPSHWWISSETGVTYFADVMSPVSGSWCWTSVRIALLLLEPLSCLL